MTKEGVWHHEVPVEKSVYYWDNEPLLWQPEHSFVNNGKPLLVDLFSGCGGFSVGFEAQGFHSILAIDIFKPAISTFSKNHPESAYILGDIRQAENDLIIQSVQDRHIAVITAGVPCQGFSLCNRKRNDEDERNYLFLEFIRIVRLLKPDYILLENVSGLRSAKSGGFRNEIKDLMTECGYNVKVRMLNAADYGVPQLRNRLLFFGAREGRDVFWPQPTHGGKNLPYVTVWDAIGDLPNLGSGENKNKYEAQPFSKYQEWSRSKGKVLLNHEAPNHPVSTIKRIEETEQGEPLYSSFRQRIRLSQNKPSPTQVCGGIRPQFQFGHPTQARGLSVRERCRLQSFPDDYEICGGIVQGRVQTGNAVPPLLASAIAKQIANSMNDVPISERNIIGDEEGKSPTLF